MRTLEDIRLAVFGPGLLGGSLLHDARELHARELRVWARREAPLAETRAMGLADFTSTDPVAVAEGADVIVLCVPVGGMKALAAELAASRPAPGAVFTDVGSVKGMVMREVAPLLTGAGFPFIGSHPMAGSEKTGLEASRAGLYRGAACILTPAPGTCPSAVERLEGFWKTLGCRVVQMDPVEHDNVVARVSHLPHVASMLATLVALRSDPGRGQFAAGGLRDTTRVASGDPGMWREILLENREALLPALRDLRDASDEVLRAVETGDGDLLSAMLREARDLRALHYS